MDDLTLSSYFISRRMAIKFAILHCTEESRDDILGLSELNVKSPLYKMWFDDIYKLIEQDTEELNKFCELYPEPEM